MTTHALALSLALDERGLHPATTKRVHLVVEVTALAAGIERARPPLSVVLAVDSSGSMSGPPIEHVVQSIDRLIALLDPTDRVGVVAFSNNASEVAPLLAATPENRRLVSTRCHRLVAEGGTNVWAGLSCARDLLPARAMHERQVILLLSDGAPNVGKSSTADLSELSRSFRPGVGVSTLGYGAHHNEDVLQAISDAGGGRYQFIADPKVCEIEFARAIGAQGDVVADGIELSIVPAEGVEIVRFLGGVTPRFGAGGIRVAVPDLLEGSSFLLAAEVSLTTPREAGAWTPVHASVSYRAAGAPAAPASYRAPADRGEGLVLEGALAAQVGQGEPQVDPSGRAKVLRVRADEVRAEARALADRGQFDGAAAVLRRQIQAIQAEPWFVQNDGSPLAEAVEQLVDEAVALERKPSQEEYRTFRKSQFVTSVRGDAIEGSAQSALALSAVAGELPKARLHVLNGKLAGKTFDLSQPRVIIGRTSAADIPVADPSVSRCHLTIAAQHGKFLAVDMGSTNTSLVNGEPMARPVTLAPGDVLRIGQVEIRYEEDKT